MRSAIFRLLVRPSVHRTIIHVLIRIILTSDQLLVAQVANSSPLKCANIAIEFVKAALVLPSVSLLFPRYIRTYMPDNRRDNEVKSFLGRYSNQPAGRRREPIFSGSQRGNFRPLMCPYASERVAKKLAARIEANERGLISKCPSWHS